MSFTVPKDWTGIFDEAAQEVLETMFFAAVFGPAEHLGASSSILDPVITAQLRFEGTPSGRLQVSLTENAARSITGNFLGSAIPEELSIEEIESVVGELANIICGSVLSKMDGQMVFSLSHPFVSSIASTATESIAASFELADGVLTARMIFDAAGGSE